MSNVNSPDNPMVGQWLGWQQVEGVPDSFLMLNIESRSPNDALVCGLVGKEQIRTVCRGSLEISGSKVSGTTQNFLTYDPDSDTLIPILEFYNKFGLKEPPPSRANYTASYDGKSISGNFTNDIGVSGQFRLWKKFSEACRIMEPLEPNTLGPINWEDYKKMVSAYRPRDRVLFRGQKSNQYSLRTSLHRRGRNNIFLYLEEDVKRLRHRINSISTHYYQPYGEDLIGLISLSQHHGFPTPLLDWSESPFVAAFFAFDCINSLDSWKNDQPPVRIYTIDRPSWENHIRLKGRTLRDPIPDFQFIEPAAHNNPRYYPQQSVAAFSTVEDIETFLATIEKLSSKTFLTRIDIHAAEREKAENDLRFMGITAATMFPGIEGACRSLAAELF